MYLINKLSLEIISVPLPDDYYINDKGEVTEFTNLQVAYMNLRQSERVNYFEQQTLPSCDPKYYKISENSLIEMSAAEKSEVDKK